MKFLSVFRKTLLEMSRDKWMLGLTLAFAPFFVLLYWLITAGGSTTYTILTINNDRGIRLVDGTTFNAGRAAVAALDVEFDSGDAEFRWALHQHGAFGPLHPEPDFLTGE